jgi:Cof subfamily protein (haloacid dehalogenase superfamily)
MMTYRLAAFDLDGTLLGPDLTLSARVKAAVARALAQGVAVAIATGRGIWPTEQFAAELGLTAPLICFQGGLLYDFRDKRVLHETRLDPVVIPAIVQLAAERGWNLEFETPYTIYLRHSDRHSEMLLNLRKMENLCWVEDYLREMPETPHKFLISVEEAAQRDSVEAEVRACWDQSLARLTIVPSHPLLVEGIPYGMSKAVGVDWLARRLGVRREEVMAVGDNDNDAEMLAWAGLGVAMGHASPKALAAASETVPPVAEDGAAVALEKFVLRQG